jgi:hypothetical protein
MSPALAGECPAGMMKPNAREAVTFAPKGLTDTVLGAIDLAKEPAKIKDRQLRFRKLTIEPGGIVPWHSHADRPAIIYIAEGEIIEYASNCAAPNAARGSIRKYDSCPRSLLCAVYIDLDLRIFPLEFQACLHRRF